jgi:drug/metabolite transporter (DMT)-like permease
MEDHLSLPRTIMLTALAMFAFAANSVLCRLALSETAIDPATFTLVRLASGAAMLWLIVSVAGRGAAPSSSWRAAVALFVYATTFSFAYISLSAGTGALLLFGAVQATMVSVGLVRGDQLRVAQWLGFLVALAGLAALVAPGISAPPIAGASLMLVAGVAWGVYSLLGRGSDNPLGATAGNFVRSLSMAIALFPVVVFFGGAVSALGLFYAVLSGALTSGVGYAIWYAALPGLTPAQAASVQLSVPVITALSGAALLGEAITFRLVASTLAILGGIALVIANRKRARSAT